MQAGDGATRVAMQNGSPPSAATRKLDGRKAARWVSLLVWLEASRRGELLLAQTGARVSQERVRRNTPAQSTCGGKEAAMGSTTAGWLETSQRGERESRAMEGVLRVEGRGSRAECTSRRRGSIE